MADRGTLFGPIKQVAWLVRDLEASMARWMEQAGVGPWTCFENVTLNGEMNGRPTTVLMDVGLSYRDGVQIELIRVRSSDPCPYLDASGTPLTGMHHIAYLSEDVDADVARAEGRGLRTIFRAENPATKVAYLEAPGEEGVIIELIEARPAIMEGFKTGQAACDAWDGTPHVERIDLGAIG